MTLSGKVALVTGAGKGVGAATALKLAQQGLAVAVNDLREGDAAETVRRIQAAGGKAIVAVADVTDADAVARMVGQVAQTLGGVDILVNNAGGGGPTRTFEETSVEVWDQTMALNLRSVFLCTKAVLPYMKRRGWGRVVNVASVAGRGRSLTGGPQYSASKAGVIGFTRHVSAELAPFGITVNAVAPSMVATERIKKKFGEMPEDARERVIANIPVGRWSEPEEVAAAIVFLCSDESGYICGAVLDVNGGTWVG